MRQLMLLFGRDVSFLFRPLKGLPQVVCLCVMSFCCACSPTMPTEEPFYAPDFTLTALDGSSYTLSDLRGRWVIVTFWATNCPPCVEDMPLLQHMAQDSEEVLIVLGVNMREETALILPFLKQYDIRFPILVNPYDQMLLDYNVIGLPQTLLITPAGEMADRRFGPVAIEEWEQMIADGIQFSGDRN